MTWVDPPDFSAGSVHRSSDHDDISGDLEYLYHLAHTASANRVPSGSWTTSSNSFVDWNGASTLEVPFTKRGGTETQLKVDLQVSGYITGGATSLLQLGVAVAGTDYSNSIPHYWSTAADYQEYGETIFVPNLAAGSYSPKLRVLVVAGGFTYNIDGNAFGQMVVSEVVVG